MSILKIFRNIFRRKPAETELPTDTTPDKKDSADLLKGLDRVQELNREFPTIVADDTNKEQFLFASFLYNFELSDGKLLRDVFHIVKGYIDHSRSYSSMSLVDPCFKCIWKNVDEIKFFIDNPFEEYRFADCITKNPKRYIFQKPVIIHPVKNIIDIKKFCEMVDTYYTRAKALKVQLAENKTDLIKYSMLEYGKDSGFKMCTNVRPDRVDEIINKDTMQYATEYRAYIIEKLADASIGSAYSNTDIKEINHKQPTARVEWYNTFAEAHLRKLETESLNKKYGDVISEIRTLAVKKVAAMTKANKKS